jgi:hypothetical protein
MCTPYSVQKLAMSVGGSTAAGSNPGKRIKAGELWTAYFEAPVDRKRCATVSKGAERDFAPVDIKGAVD